MLVSRTRTQDKTVEIPIETLAEVAAQMRAGRADLSENVGPAVDRRTTAEIPPEELEMLIKMCEVQK